MEVWGESAYQSSPRNLIFPPRHLQRFWGASGHFWQAQWEKLLLTFEGKEWVLFVTGELPRRPALRAWLHDYCSFSDGLVLYFGTSQLIITRNKDLSLSQW